MTPAMPKIIAYHPEIYVNKNGEHHIMKFRYPDYYDEPTILKELALKFGITTVGGVLEAVQNGKVADAIAEIIPVSAEKAGHKLWGYDEVVV